MRRLPPRGLCGGTHDRVGAYFFPAGAGSQSTRLRNPPRRSFVSRKSAALYFEGGFTGTRSPVRVLLSAAHCSCKYSCVIQSVNRHAHTEHTAACGLCSTVQLFRMCTAVCLFLHYTDDYCQSLHTTDYLALCSVTRVSRRAGPSISCPR